MDILLTYILPGIVSVFIAIITFIVKSIFTRLDVLEDKISRALTEEDVRAILSDKIDPIKEDVHEIKQAIIKFYDLYMNEKNKRD